MGLRLGLFTTLTLIWVGCPLRVAQPTPSTPKVALKARTPQPSLDRIVPRMERFIADKEIAGAVTLVAHRDKIAHFAATGWRDRERQLKMSKNTIFAIASMTKPLTAAALMVLIDAGRARLSDPVGKHLPAFRKLPRLKIKHLLTHTSGLGHGGGATLRQVARQMAAGGTRFSPGGRWQYGGSIDVVGRLIQVLSGMPYAEFLSEAILEPLEMRDTTFVLDQNKRHRLARLYMRRGNGIVPTQHRQPGAHGQKGLANPSAGLFSTASDLWKFYSMMVRQGKYGKHQILTPATVKKMTTNQTGEIETGFTPGNRWGLGFCLVWNPQGMTAMLSRGTYGHGGAFGTQAWVDPQRQVTMILMIARLGFGNSDHSLPRQALQRIATDWADAQRTSR